MGYSVPFTEYEACGRCGDTRPRHANPRHLPVTTRDLARALTDNNISRLIGQPQPPVTLRARMLLEANLLRLRAVVEPGTGGPLTGHSIMDAHHGSARVNLSEDFGIAIATSFLTRVHSCRDHYNLDAVANREKFGILASKRPDIGSVTRNEQHVLTESKGRKKLRDLEPRPSRVEPARLVKNSFQQLTSGGEARLEPSTRLFLCVTSRIAADRALQLDAAEYVREPLFRCRACGFGNSPDDEDSRRPESRISGPDFGALRSDWYRHFAMLVGGIRAGRDESDQYHVLELARADVTIGLHQEITALASNPDADLGPQLSRILEGIPEGIDAADDDRYSDGTFIRVNWPEIEPNNEDDAGTEDDADDMQ